MYTISTNFLPHHSHTNLIPSSKYDPEPEQGIRMRTRISESQSPSRSQKKTIRKSLSPGQARSPFASCPLPLPSSLLLCDPALNFGRERGRREQERGLSDTGFKDARGRGVLDGKEELAGLEQVIHRKRSLRGALSVMIGMLPLHLKSHELTLQVLEESHLFEEELSHLLTALRKSKTALSSSTFCRSSPLNFRQSAPRPAICLCVRCDVWF